MATRIGIELTTEGSHRLAVDRTLGGLKILPGESRGPCRAAIPARLLTFRSLTLPFSDRRRLDGLVETELRNGLAFSLDQAAWDYTVFASAPPGSPNVFAVACPRATLEPQLARLEGDANKVEVDAEPYAFQRILTLAGKRDALLLDVGAERTIYGRLVGGHLDTVRVLLQGTVQLHERLAQAPGPATTHAFFAQLLAEALLPDTPSEIPLYLSGVGGQEEGILAVLGEVHQRAVEPLPMPADLSPWTDAVPLGMALGDLRHGEEVHLRPKAVRTTPWMHQAAAWVAVALCLWGADLVGRDYSLRRQVQAYDDAILACARQAAPEANIRSFAADRLQTLVSQRGGSSADGQKPAPEVLDLLGVALTKARQSEPDATLKVFEVALDRQELRVQGEAGSFKQIETLHRGLDALGSVHEESSRGAGSAKVFAFTLRVSLEKP